MELQTAPRTAFQKANKNLRRKGLIPANFYGRGMPNQSLEIGQTDFQKVFKEAGENTVIYLNLAGKKQPTLVHEVQYDPVSHEVLHVDFYGVRMDEKIKTMVPLEFTGEAPAVKEKGGVLNKGVLEIEVEALPADLPHSLAADLSGLAELNQSIYVKDIKVPKNVKILLDPETAVATVTEPAPEEEVTPPSAEVAEVKVETEEKKAEREAAKSAEAAPEGKAEEKNA